ncbi:hypothetical protein MKX03_031533 [Papaver bracteatum]|nr:hypothetical protein MKX03_031533 [Papaver bracteatum]
MMARNQTSIFAFWILFALVICGSSLAKEDDLSTESTMKENCSYTIIIQTTCAHGAETSNNVSIRFGDIKSNDIVVKHLNSKHMRQVDPLQPDVYDEKLKKPFQMCTVDEFRVTGPCVKSPVCYLYLKSMGDDKWRPGLAQVRVSGASHLSSTEFYFRRYLPQHVWHGKDRCDKEVTPFGIKRKRKFFPRI